MKSHLVKFVISKQRFWGEPLLIREKKCIHLFNEAALISNIVADFIIKPKPWQPRVQAKKLRAGFLCAFIRTDPKPCDDCVCSLISLTKSIFKKRPPPLQQWGTIGKYKLRLCNIAFFHQRLLLCDFMSNHHTDSAWVKTWLCGNSYVSLNESAATSICNTLIP